MQDDPFAIGCNDFSESINGLLAETLDVNKIVDDFDFLFNLKVGEGFFPQVV